MNDMERSEREVERGKPPIVAIDGDRIRAIREGKKLTQLYVSSVVGVTTDTISRWENNRYPSIRRDNAEKLAAALEVDIAEILRMEEPIPPAPPVEKKRSLVSLIIIGVLLIAVGALAIWFFYTGEVEVQATRRLPKFAAPGAIIPIQLTILRHGDSGSGLVVKEHLPTGWHVVKANPHRYAGQAGTDEVKWLVPGGSAPVNIDYTVQVPTDSEMNASVQFDGNVISTMGGESISGKTGGDSKIMVGAFHWADTNGDGRIDDSEVMPAYYLSEEMKGLGLNWPEIEAIWNGKGYRWDSEHKKFMVIP